MKTKKIPLRTCVITKESLPKKELLRIVRTPDQDIVVDETGKVTDENGEELTEVVMEDAVQKVTISKNDITYGGTEGYLTVLDSDYYIVTGEDVFSFDLSDWSLTSVGASFVADYARKGISDEVTEHVRKLDPVMCSYESRGIVMLDKYDSLIWNGDPEGTIRNRVTRNRARDFNLAGEWIFYHNLDDQDNLWCVRRDGADDHRV